MLIPYSDGDVSFVSFSPCPSNLNHFLRLFLLLLFFTSYFQAIYIHVTSSKRLILFSLCTLYLTCKTGEPNRNEMNFCCFNDKEHILFGFKIHIWLTHSFPLRLESKKQETSSNVVFFRPSVLIPNDVNKMRDYFQKNWFLFRLLLFLEQNNLAFLLLAGLVREMKKRKWNVTSCIQLDGQIWARV